MTVSVKIAATALGLSSLALMNSRGAFAAAIAIGVLAMLFSPDRAKTAKTFRRAAVAPVAVMAAAVLFAWIPSTALSYFPWTSIQVLARMAAFLGLGVGVYAYFVDRPQALDLLLKTLLVGLAFGLLVADFSIVAAPGLMVLLKGHVVDNVGHARLMMKAVASAAVVLLPFVLWAGWRLGGRWKGAVIAVALELLTLTVVAGSRAGMAGLIGALGITLVATMTRKESSRRIAGLILTLLAVMATILIFLIDHSRISSVPERVLTFPSWLVDPHRQVIWGYSLDLAAQRPWTGWGINTINLVPPPPSELSPIEYGLPVMPGHPHNWIIEVFAETGIVGSVPLLLAVTALFVAALRRYRIEGDLRFLAMLAASAAFWVSGLFNFSFWSAWWQVSYILVLALLSAGRSAPGSPPQPSPHG